MDLALTQFPDAKQSTSKVSLSEKVFAVEFNPSLVHQILTAYQAAGRAGTRGTKNRSDVSGGGAKPWRQKGTGRARAGTSSSPIWRSGGDTFRKTLRDYSQKVNRKMYRGAMRCILSEQVRRKAIFAVADIEMATPKTKDFLAKYNLPADKKLLIIDAEVSQDLHRATRNLHWTNVTDVTGLDPVSLFKAEQILVSKAALSQLEEWLS